jgi:HK97 family phage prohead protease
MKNLIKYRDFGGSDAVKDVDPRGRTITGYAAAFNNVDLGNDLIEPGAFKKTIKERGPKGSNRIFFLNQHDTWQIVSKPTLLKEDAYGLYHESPVPDTTLGNDVLKLFDAGIMDSFSIGYKTISESMENGVNHLKELFLYEFSGVTFPMNEAAMATGVKSLDASRIADKIKRMEKFCADTDASDDTIELLLLNIKQLQQIVIDLTTTTPPPGKGTEPRTGVKDEAAETLIREVNNFKDWQAIKQFSQTLRP